METIVVIKELLCSFIYGCIGGFVIILPHIIYVQFKKRRRLNKWFEYAEIKNVEIEQALESFNQRIMKPHSHQSSTTLSSYIEVLIKEDDIDTWNLVPGADKKFHIGDKIAIDRNRIRESDFMADIFTNNTRNAFLLQEQRYFESSNICFIQITKKIWHENYVEFHAKRVTEDGIFIQKNKT